MSRIEILTSADSRFELPLAVMLKSVELASQGVPTRVTVISPSTSFLERLDFLGDIEVRGVDWSELDIELDDESFTIPSYLSKAAVARLGVDDLYGADSDTVLYLDADVLVRRSLVDLFAVGTAGRPIAAVHDLVIPWAGAPQGLPVRDLKIDPWTPYFNSGVMVINLEGWRSSGVRDMAIEALRHPDIRWADQCALNIALNGNWSPLAPVWNAQSGIHSASLAWQVYDNDTLEAARLNPAIIHFNTSALGRPWNHPCFHPLKDEWFRVAELTPYRHIARPRATMRYRAGALARRVAGSVIR